MVGLQRLSVGIRNFNVAEQVKEQPYKIRYLALSTCVRHIDDLLRTIKL